MRKTAVIHRLHGELVDRRQPCARPAMFSKVGPEVGGAPALLAREARTPSPTSMGTRLRDSAPVRSEQDHAILTDADWPIFSCGLELAARSARFVRAGVKARKGAAQPVWLPALVRASISSTGYQIVRNVLRE
jgi:hypothetical protein